MRAKSCLLCHTDSGETIARDFYIATRVAWYEQILKFHFDLTGPVHNLIIPAPQGPAETDGLWQHTCFEAFIGVWDESHYHEFNFAPSGLWAGYAFSEYRRRQAWQSPDAPAISSVCSPERLSLVANLSEANLPVNPHNKPFRLGLSAVLEHQDGTLSYWALCHPAGKPDFHHRCGFTLSLNLV